MENKLQKLRIKEAEALSKLTKTFKIPQFDLMKNYIKANNDANQEVLNKIIK